MTMKVLQDNEQINTARQELDKKGASCIVQPDTRMKALMRRLSLVSGMPMGDMVKSWDVHATLEFMESNVKKNEPILDIGCYASEILASLHKVGYSNLTGADLNPHLNRMPYQNSIKYEVTNFMHTKFKDASFKAITSISVIEHDFKSQPLLKEMSRLLMPGGYFIASFDYWPDKIDTTGTQFFGMDWNIFSKDDVANFVNEAASYGLFPLGTMNYSCKDKPIDCAEKQYTFGWLVLKKSV